ncbi:MAG: hypothetical protein KAH46_02295, partial [Mycobacterium sp.]|nr:hypothetical protein [Mycobacterium sp.]
VAEVRRHLTVSTPEGPLHTFRAQISRGSRTGEWIESAPSLCPNGCDLTQPRALLVGWNSTIEPPHRTWTCRRCDVVIHNLDSDAQY